VRDFQLGYNGTVPSINFDQPAKDAFKKMKELNVSSVAVLNSQGKLYGNLSATDLRVLGADTSFYMNLSKKIEDFMKDIPPNPIFGLNPIFVRPSDNLRLVVRKFVDSGVHRLYLVEEGFELIGVITLAEFIKLLLRCCDEKAITSPPRTPAAIGSSNSSSSQ